MIVNHEKDSQRLLSEKLKRLGSKNNSQVLC